MSCSNLQDLLDDAKKQYHLLRTGRAASVIVQENGERVEFTKADANKLAGYIVELEGKIAGTPKQLGPAIGVM